MPPLDNNTIELLSSFQKMLSKMVLVSILIRDSTAKHCIQPFAETTGIMRSAGFRQALLSDLEALLASICETIDSEEVGLTDHEFV